MMCYLNCRAATILGTFDAAFRIPIFDHGFQHLEGQMTGWLAIGGNNYHATAKADFQYFLPGCDVLYACLVTVPTPLQLFAAGQTKPYSGGNPVFEDSGTLGSTLGNGFGRMVFAA